MRLEKFSVYTGRTLMPHIFSWVSTAYRCWAIAYGFEFVRQRRIMTAIRTDFFR